jgi:hypothetical protein
MTQLTRFAAFVVCLILVPASATPKQHQRPRRAQTIAGAWLALPRAEGHGCGTDLIFDYGDGGGMRNFFCRALTIFSWKRFLTLAPVSPFRAGPHRNGKLDLNSEEFGRYDPRFVRWATDNLIPARQDPTLRRSTQPIYDKSMRDLARTYWDVHRALTSNPTWRAAEQRAYVGGQRDSWILHDLLGDSSEDWGGYDPNHVRSATLWWFRRHEDGTADLWQQGLVRLLETYDRKWLDEHRQAWTRPLPRRPETPEYRD